MRIALFADIHANREALEACLHHVESQQAEQYVFLGDMIGYGADPGWVLDTVIRYRERGAIVIMGNHDEAVFKDPGRMMNDEAYSAVEWTRFHLTDRHLKFLAGLPYAIEDEDRLYVHANAWDPRGWHYIASAFEARRSLDATHCRITFCGHLHEPVLYHQATNGRAVPFTPVSGVGIPYNGHRRWVAVLGSVGQPRDGNPAVCYTILDSARRELTYYRVPFDVETAAQKIREAGLPEWFGTRLKTGV